MKDSVSVARLAKLHPLVRDTFKAFIEECEEKLDITLRITQGVRTIEEQDALYAQGRTAPGKIVTNAKGGSSYHNFALAIDVVEMKDGKANWNFDYSKLEPSAKKFNIEWGGRWKFVDKPHFQISHGLTCAQLRNKSKDEGGYVMV